MVLTFCISFAVTLYMKSDHPADSLGAVEDKIFSDDEPIKPRGVSPIKTLFDERNNQPFDPKQYDTDKPNRPAANNKPSVTDRPKPIETPTPEPARYDNPPPARKEEELGFFGTLDRMTSIKPAVDAKIKSIPHYTTIEKMPYILLQAVIAVEDTRFYKH